MDGITYFGRRFVTEQDMAAADRRAVRVALAMTAALFLVVVAAVLALGATGLLLPGVDAYPAIPVGA